MKREEKKKLTRAKILATAEKMFSDKGIKKTDIREIAKSSGVSVVTFYKYFASKEELLTEITIKKLTEVASLIKLNLATSTDDVMSTMKRIDDLVESHTSNLHNAEFDEFLNIAFFSNPEVIAAQEAMTKDIVTAVYEQLKKTNQLQDGVTLEAMLMYVDMIVQYSRLPKNRGILGPHPRHAHTNLEQEVLNILMYGLIKKSGWEKTNQL